ncbi:MAG: 50S ribosomal protein L6 [Gammaproteobacteria bacterium]|nr:50S ribosomal protein L6 [Gammaproteobacteria bacterium]
MSRVANNPIEVPSGVEVKLEKDRVTVKGGKGTLEMALSRLVEVAQRDNVLTFAPRTEERDARALAGTTRSLVNNMVIGVSEGYTRRLQLQGVGYRAQVQGDKLDLQLGFSHPVQYVLPDGIQAETPSQTEIVLTGINKQLVGQVAAEIRSVRPPEPYKGKGVRYAGERVRRKEAKKK